MPRISLILPECYELFQTGWRPCEQSFRRMFAALSHHNSVLLHVCDRIDKTSAMTETLRNTVLRLALNLHVLGTTKSDALAVMNIL